MRTKNDTNALNKLDDLYNTIMPQTKSAIASLALYLTCNLLLSISNKILLRMFPFPWVITAVHATITSIGCTSLLLRKTTRTRSLSAREALSLLIFSSLFTINIAISNVSLSLVSLSFHQLIRAAGPIFTVLISKLIYKRKYHVHTYTAIGMMVFGMGMATYGEYLFTTTGFWLTMLGVFLAAVKTVTTNRLMTGTLQLDPLQVLIRTSPLAAVQALVVAMIAGEITRARTYFTHSPHIDDQTRSNTSASILAILTNGLLALTQNMVSFHTNKVTGPVTMAVCANVKQCLVILCAILVFDTDVRLLDGFGMVVALISCAWYSYLELGLNTTDRMEINELPASKTEQRQD